LELTKNCNFRCRYCFEDFKGGIFEQTPIFIHRIKQLLDSSFFKKRYHLLNIGFWGGEPTLNFKAVQGITQFFAKDDRVKFSIYTNGYNLSTFIDTFIRFRDFRMLGGHPKFSVQVSYDGMPIHDIYRVKADGTLTSSVVRSNIDLLNKERIPNTLKSTITPEVFKYMPDAYLDIRDIFESYTGTDFFKGHNYMPTIEYYKANTIDDLSILEYNEVLKKSLIKIAGYEIKHFEKYESFLLSWFNGGKALCSAGRDVIAMNVLGNIYVCHGCLYSEQKDDHYITSLEDEDFIEKLNKYWLDFNTDFGCLPDECQLCDTNFCLKCNLVKFENSNKIEYFDKWRDYSNQPALCAFYKTSGKIVKAIHKALDAQRRI
jgi:sulfatase maturation enzyme AslB (radical SAM superfamily)